MYFEVLLCVYCIPVKFIVFPQFFEFHYDQFVEINHFGFGSDFIVAQKILNSY